MRKIFYLILPASLCYSCNKPATVNNRAALEKLANRSCQAIAIREQRFLLADKIRFAQDTLMHVKVKSDSGRIEKQLKIYLQQKAGLLQKSIALADTIRLQLDSLMPYTDKQAQKRFTASLDSLLQKKGCAGKNQTVPAH